MLDRQKTCRAGTLHTRDEYHVLFKPISSSLKEAHVLENAWRELWGLKQVYFQMYFILNVFHLLWWCGFPNSEGETKMTMWDYDFECSFLVIFSECSILKQLLMWIWRAYFSLTSGTSSHAPGSSHHRTSHCATACRTHKSRTCNLFNLLAS